MPSDTIRQLSEVINLKIIISISWLIASDHYEDVLTNKVLKTHNPTHTHARTHTHTRARARTHTHTTTTCLPLYCTCVVFPYRIQHWFCSVDTTILWPLCETVSSFLKKLASHHNASFPTHLICYSWTSTC